MSVLVVSCSKCGQQFGIPAGKQAACPKCMTINQPRVGGPVQGVMLSKPSGPIQGIALGGPQPWMGAIPGANYGPSSPLGQGSPLALHQTPPAGFAISPPGQGGFGPSYGAGGFVSPQGPGPANPLVGGFISPPGAGPPIAHSPPGSPYAGILATPASPVANLALSAPGSPYAGILPTPASPMPNLALSGVSGAIVFPQPAAPTPVTSAALSPPGERLVMLSFLGFNLPKSSSLVVAVESSQGPLPEFKQEPFRTEVVFGDKNPVWARKLEVPKRDDIKLAFVVFEKDKRYAVLDGTPLSDIMGTTGQWRAPLKDPKTGFRLPQAAIAARWEEISSGGDMVDFEPAATGLRSYDSNGLSDPFMQIFRVDGPGALTLVHQTEVIPKCLTPTWKPFSLRLSLLTGNPSFSAPTTHSTGLHFKLFDWNPSGKTNFMGEIKTTLGALVTNQTTQGPGTRFPLTKDKDKKKMDRGLLYFNKINVRALPVASSVQPQPVHAGGSPRGVMLAPGASAIAVAGPGPQAPQGVMLSPGPGVQLAQVAPQGVMLNPGLGAYRQSVGARPPDYQDPDAGYEPPPSYDVSDVPVASPALNEEFSREPLMSVPAASVQHQEEVWEEIPPELLQEVDAADIVFQQQQQALLQAQQQQQLLQQQFYEQQQQEHELLLLQQQQDEQQQQLIFQQQQQLHQQFQQLAIASPSPAQDDVVPLSSPLIMEAQIALPDGPLVMPAPLPLPFEPPVPVFDEPPQPFFAIPPEDMPPALPEPVRGPPPAARGPPPAARGAPPAARGAPPAARGPVPQGNYPYDPNFRGGLASSRPAHQFSVDHAMIHKLIFIMSTPPALQYLATVCDAPFRSTLHRPSVERLAQLLGTGTHIEWDAVPFDLKDQVPNLLKIWCSASNFRFGQDQNSDLNMALVCRAIISTGLYYKTFDSMSIAFTALNDLDGVYQSNYGASG